MIVVDDMYASDDDALDAVTAAIRCASQHGHQHSRPLDPASPIAGFGQDVHDYYGYGSASMVGQQASTKREWQQRQQRTEEAEDSSWGPGGKKPTEMRGPLLRRTDVMSKSRGFADAPCDEAFCSSVGSKSSKKLRSVAKSGVSE
jgi:hypothetical protein